MRGLSITLLCFACVGIGGCLMKESGGASGVVEKSSKEAGVKSPVSHQSQWLMSIGMPFGGMPKNVKPLHEIDDLTLFVGETESDMAFNAKSRNESRNSLFLWRRTKDGTDEWRLLLTSLGDWKAAEGMERFGRNWTGDVYRCLDIRRANLSKDGRSIWLVCDSHNSLFSLVCRYDLREKAFWVLTDGDSADEEPDGTIWVLNKKIYLTDKNGEPDGAAWREEWITPDGKVVRKGEPRRAEDVLCYEEAVKLRKRNEAK